jgi:hypothetical protein
MSEENLSSMPERKVSHITKIISLPSEADGLLFTYIQYNCFIMKTGKQIP